MHCLVRPVEVVVRPHADFVLDQKLSPSSLAMSWIVLFAISKDQKFVPVVMVVDGWRHGYPWPRYQYHPRNSSLVVTVPHVLVDWLFCSHTTGIENCTRGRLDTICSLIGGIFLIASCRRTANQDCQLHHGCIVECSLCKMSAVCMLVTNSQWNDWIKWLYTNPSVQFSCF